MKQLEELTKKYFSPIYESLYGKQPSSVEFNNWNIHINLLIEDQLVTEKNIVKILQWLMEDGSDNIFWRKVIKHPSDFRNKKTDDVVPHIGKICHLATFKNFYKDSQSELIRRKKKEKLEVMNQEEKSRLKKQIDLWIANNSSKYDTLLYNAKSQLSKQYNSFPDNFIERNAEIIVRNTINKTLNSS